MALPFIVVLVSGYATVLLLKNQLKLGKVLRKLKLVVSFAQMVSQFEDAISALRFPNSLRTIGLPILQVLSLDVLGLDGS